ASQFPGATADDVVGQGGATLQLDGLTLSATALTTQDDDVLNRQLLCSTVTYTNTSDAPGSYNVLDWSLQNPQGAAQTWGAWGDNELNSGDLAPGGTTTGDVCFESDAAPGQYVLLYDGSWISDERGAWINTL
ncbi:DUF4352 domain-containing protein, partial [Kineococcus indalonis]|uniref:DUF4352 domain-containing protein n=1 Tax=Kineococcus indalonis TaxID=2696566 RepID=UPI001412271B